ncbi:MAG: hypothetical protein DRI74_08160 [Bacteroidetes bacterium]|nr:MAG: hypothetical protein DRI74_08160 [Bacteroidota bacterium]
MKSSKYVFLSFVFLFLVKLSWGQDDVKIKFSEGTLKDYQSMAAQENKGLIIEFLGEKPKENISQSNKIFNDVKIAAALSEQFILYRYNSKSDKRGTIKKQYDITKFPTYLFLDGQGQERYRIAGKFSKDAFLQAVAYALSEDNNMYVWKQMIKEGSVPNSDIYFNYAKGLMLGGQDYETAAADYFKNSNVDFTKENHGMEAILLFTEDMNNPRFLILAENIHSIGNSDLDEVFIHKRMNEIISNSLVDALVSNDEISIEDTVIKTAEKFMIEDPAMLSAIVKIKYYSTVKKNQDEYYRAVIDYLFTGMFTVEDNEVFDYLKDIAKNCNNQDINMMAINRLLDLIAENNKTEYQKIMIDLSIKNHDFIEANHALEVLKKLNKISKTYSPNELDSLSVMIIEAQNNFKSDVKKEESKKANSKRTR